MLTRIINLSPAISEKPRELKCAILRPLLKKAKADPEVFLTFLQCLISKNNVSKVIEKSVAAQLNDYLVCNDCMRLFNLHTNPATVLRQH